MKKLLTTEAVWEIASSDELAKAGEIFISAFGNWEWVKRGVADLTYNAVTVEIGRTTKYIVVWHKIANLFRIAAAAHIAGEYDFDSFFAVTVDYAKRAGCIGIEAITRRRGMMQKLVNGGFKTIGIHLAYEIA